MNECYVCGKTGNMQKHHIIHGHGKRKACETKESFVDICFNCHCLVHRRDDTNLDFMLKQLLQAAYYEKGYEEERIRTLMGGKLIPQQ